MIRPQRTLFALAAAWVIASLTRGVDATAEGSRPRESRAVVNAPAANRHLTLSMCPPRLAKCSGVDSFNDKTPKFRLFIEEGERCTNNKGVTDGPDTYDTTPAFRLANEHRLRAEPGPVQLQPCSHMLTPNELQRCPLRSSNQDQEAQSYHRAIPIPSLTSDCNVIVFSSRRR